MMNSRAGLSLLARRTKTFLPKSAAAQSYRCTLLALPVHGNVKGTQFRAFTAPSVRQNESKAFSNKIPVTGERTPIGQIEPRLAITFTCAVTDCGHRSTHEFTKRSYTKGIVIIQCPSCKNRHLIADNLSWFTDSTDPRNIEEIIAAKGGQVTRGTVYSDGLDSETLEIQDTTLAIEDKPSS